MDRHVKAARNGDTIGELQVDIGNPNNSREVASGGEVAGGCVSQSGIGRPELLNRGSETPYKVVIQAIDFGRFTKLLFQVTLANLPVPS